MNLSIYLAFTGAETSSFTSFTGNRAWLGSRLSSCSTGISTILPPGGHCDMLILTDETPPCGHDPERVASELSEVAKHLACRQILLDFQRDSYSESGQIIDAVLKASPCTVGVSEAFAERRDCPVFLSAPPLWILPEDHIAPWKSREIWLEAVTEDVLVSVTETGSRYIPCANGGVYPFTDSSTCVSYRTELLQNEARFFLHRGTEELAMLLQKAFDLGIHTAVGLHQQLGTGHSN